jgi:hypothetical protein
VAGTETTNKQQVIEENQRLFNAYYTKRQTMAENPSPASYNEYQEAHTVYDEHTNGAYKDIVIDGNNNS